MGRAVGAESVPRGGTRFALNAGVTVAVDMRYRDRRHAGRVLASRLERYGGAEGLVVLALPRGGVPVGFEIAVRLHAPLDVLVVRKLGLPGDEELAMGAVASGGVRVLNDDLIAGFGVSERTIENVTAIERREVDRRERAYRGDRDPVDVAGRTAILVDDGLATGSTMSAAILAIRELAPRRLIVAVPIASPGTCKELSTKVDEMICAATPEPLRAVGLWYADFEQTSDTEVRALLEAARSIVSEHSFEPSAPSQRPSP
jgi:predicted phosphoribosyltransferase